MKRASEQPPLSTQLAKRLFPLTLIVGILIALVIPGVYYSLEVRRAANEATTYAKRVASEIRSVAAESPVLWKYQATRYAQIIHSLVTHGEINTISVLDEKGERLTQYDHATAGAGPRSILSIPGTRAPIVLNHVVVGHVEVTILVDKILLRTVICFLFCVITGASLGTLLYRFPLKIVAELESQIFEYQETLEAKVEQRTLALQEVTKKAIELSEEAQAAAKTKSQFLANMSH
ncbi:MAG: hypothetical protein LLG06_13500, partial [Desulfobacteraceae bacterium]|nr:hypothetical protein [Desulfobacteraceae bacterium]